jgi:hypothetical protein
VMKDEDNTSASAAATSIAYFIVLFD